ncbi:tetratricopeptide repeat protein [Maribellus luteus]|nr:tetratricopeptide repeat protein [Maribellus luteus]
MNEQYNIEEIRQLEKNLSEKPDDTDLMNKLAIGYLNCREADSFNKVDDLLKKAFEIKPSIKTSNNYAYQIITDRDDYEKGIEILKPFVDKKPKSFMPYNVIGYAYLMKGNYEKAKFYFEKAMTLSQTEMVEIIHNLAVCENHLGNPQKALNLYDKSIAINDKDNESKFNKAVCLYELGSHSEIEEIIQTIRKSAAYKDSTAWVSSSELSELYYLQGDLQNAYDFFLQNPFTPDLISDLVSSFLLFNYDKPKFQKLVNEQVGEKNEWINELNDPKDEDYYDYSDEERIEQTKKLENEIHTLKSIELHLTKPPQLNPAKLYMTTFCGCMLYDCKIHRTQFDE